MVETFSQRKTISASLERAPSPSERCPFRFQKCLVWLHFQRRPVPSKCSVRFNNVEVEITGASTNPTYLRWNHTENQRIWTIFENRNKKFLTTYIQNIPKRLLAPGGDTLLPHTPNKPNLTEFRDTVVNEKTSTARRGDQLRAAQRSRYASKLQ